MKAILVMDMPENCLTCPNFNGIDECMLQSEEANFNADTFSDLREGCPLVPLSEEQAALSPTINGHSYICPRCRISRNINQKYAYCPSCGQKLAWND